MKPITTSILAFILLALGIAAATFIFVLMGRNNSPRRPGFFRWAHRVTGYVFIALYLFICVVMFQKFTNPSLTFSAKDAIHAYIGTIIFPLAVIKICIVRFFKKYYQRLPFYGMVMVIAVYLAAVLSAGYYTLSTTGGQYIIMIDKGTPVKINTGRGRLVVQQKCSGCHSLERVFAYVKTESGWRDYVSRMREKEPSLLNDDEYLQAVGYLVKNLGIDETKMDAQVGMKIILEKCHKCHTLERVFTFKKTPEEWEQTVALMRSFDPFLLNDSEARQVNHCLEQIFVRQNTGTE